MNKPLIHHKGILMLKDGDPIALFPSMLQAARVIHKPTSWVSRRCKNQPVRIMRDWEKKYEFVMAADYNAILNESNECLEGYGIELK